MTPSRSGAHLQSEPARLAVDLSAPDPIPQQAIDRAVELMKHGMLFRYGEAGAAGSDAAIWEERIADFLGRRYAVAVNSCGSALFLALHAAGLQQGDAVLMNSWTLAPVPGAVEHAGGRSVLVETTRDLTIDLDDLERQAAAHPGSLLLLSHMRGHVSDLDAVADVCARHDLRLIEDGAHSLGASWAGRLTGTWGLAGCLSTQSFKHLNSGEGGVLVTDDDEVAARAILASGSYMLYQQHRRRPPDEAFEPYLGQEPNHSMRMSALAAAVLPAQLEVLPERIDSWNQRYQRLAVGLARVSGVGLPRRPSTEQFVGSSLQFFLPEHSPSEIATFCALTSQLGVLVKWFGAPQPQGFTSAYSSWKYAAPPVLPGTDRVLAHLCDIRVPLAMTLEQCDQVVSIIEYAAAQSQQDGGRSPQEQESSRP